MEIKRKFFITHVVSLFIITPLTPYMNVASPSTGATP